MLMKLNSICFNKISRIGDPCISIFGNSYQLIIRVVRGNPIGVKEHRILMLRGKPDISLLMFAHTARGITNERHAIRKFGIATASRINVIAKFAHENVNFAVIY